MKLINHLREFYGFPQAVLAQYVGVSRGHLSMAAIGRKDLQTAAFLKLIKLALAERKKEDPEPIRTPEQGEDYVHRIGRTAPAEVGGSAYTLVSVKEERKFQAMENLIAKEDSKIIVPEHLGGQPSYNPSSSPGSNRVVKRIFIGTG